MKHTLLIIDDDPFIINTLNSKFSDWNTEVYSAVSPDEAKKQLDRVVPDLVLLDLLLTKGDGAEDILDYMKDKENLKNIPVVVLTNLDDPQLKEIMLKQGIKEYLIKGTMGLDELHKKVMGYLEPDVVK